MDLDTLRNILLKPNGEVWEGSASGTYLDFDGDGVVDYLNSKSSACPAAYSLLVRFGKRALFGGLQFDEADWVCIDRTNIAETHQATCMTWQDTSDQHLILQDFNGDGIKDYALAAGGHPSLPSGPWAIWLATRTATDWRFVYWGETPSAPGATGFLTYLRGEDLNADGFLDHVFERLAPSDPIYGQLSPIFGSLSVNQWPSRDQLFVALPLGEYGFGPPDLPQAQPWPALTGTLVCADTVVANPECPHVGMSCTTRGRDPRVAYQKVADLNGDGVSDFAAAMGGTCVDNDFDGTPDAACSPGAHTYGQLQVAYNTGRGVTPWNPVESCRYGGADACSSGTCPVSCSQLLPGRAYTGGITVKNEGFTAEGVPPEWYGSYYCRVVDAFDDSGVAAYFGDLNGDAIPDHITVEKLEDLPGGGRRFGASFRQGSYGVPVKVARPRLLTSITTPSGATIAATFGNSRDFGDLSSTRPVVTSLTTSGELIPTSVTKYWYVGYSGGAVIKHTLPYDPGRFDDRGFSATWVENVAAGLVRKTTWKQDRHALAGTPSLVESGPVITPTSDTSAPTFTTTSSSSTEYAFKRPSDTYCSALAEDVFPQLVIPTRSTARARHENAAGAPVWSQTETTIDCQHVTASGVVTRTTTQSSLAGYPGPALVTTTTLEGVARPSCKGLSGRVTVQSFDLLGWTTPLVKVAEYDERCRVTAEHALAEGGPTNLKSYFYKDDTWFGALDRTESGGVASSVVYDPDDRLNVVEERTSSSARALLTTHTYDRATGLRLSSKGPQVVGAPSIPAVERFYLYDAFGRTLAVAKEEFTTGANPAVVPAATFANQVVEAHAYVDAGSPRQVRSYRFAVPASYAVGTDGSAAVPGTDDVMLTTSFLDELGREIQATERLGTGSPASPAARVAMPLSGARVTKSVVFDAAGRVLIAWEPFHAPTGAFDDPRNGVAAAARATVTSYDAEGRPWCTSYQFVASGNVPAPAGPGGCTSSSAHDPSFALRTQVLYDAVQISGRGPHGGWFVRTRTIPPEVTELNTWNQALAGAAGEALGSIDADGNRTWVERDALGREVVSWRESASTNLFTPRPVSVSWGQPRPSNDPQAASRTLYNGAGQVIETWDANAPAMFRRTFYDSAGRVIQVLPGSPGDTIDYLYAPEGLGRVTEVRENSAAGTRTTTSTYDLPYAGNAEYGFTVGKLTSTTTEGETTIAYGYDDAGRLDRRDQWFTKLGAGKRFTVDSSYGADGRVLSSIVVNPFHAAPAYYQYDVSYDSAGRPVRLDGTLAGQATAAVYETAQQGSFGAYDALGRVAVMKADAGNAVSVRVYDAYSGLLTGECKRVGVEVDCLNQALNAARDIYRTDGPTKATYQGGKLSRYEDRGTGTTYETSYRPSGRVLETKATPGAGASTLSQDYVEHYTYNGIGNIDAVTVKRDVHGPTPLQRTETYATTPWQSPPTPIVDKVKAIEYATTQGSPPARVGVRYGYDLANRLTSVTRTAGESETLTYGPTGELLYRQIGQRFVFYVGEYATVSAAGQAGCAGAACVPQAASVAVDAHVVYAGTRIASARTASQDGTVSGRTLFYYRTRLGSVIGTSERGSPTKGASYRYTPYGEVHAEGETEATRSELGYTNALKLTGSLWYLKNRVYDAEARVFIQSDWVDRLRYAYVTGDPINLSDPTGLVANKKPDGGSSIRVIKDGSVIRIVERSGDGKIRVVAAWDTETPVSAESAQQMAKQIGLALESAKGVLGDRMPGTGAGGYALNFYVRIVNDPNSTRSERTAAYIGGFFSALWTRETAVETTVTLGVAAVASRRALAAHAGAKGADSLPSPDCAGPCGPIHSRYPDGTPVMEGRQPGKVTGPNRDAGGAPHTQLVRDDVGRLYKAREYGEGDVPVRDIDFTHPTFPNGTPRPGHTAPEQHRWTPNDPGHPGAGYVRGPGEPLELP